MKRRFDIKSGDFQKGIGVAGAEAKGAHFVVPNSGIEMELFQFTAPASYEGNCSMPANQLGYRHIALVVEDLQDAYRALKAKNIAFISEPITGRNPKRCPVFSSYTFAILKGIL